MRICRFFSVTFLLLFLSNVLFAQTSAYEARWRKIDSLMVKKDLPKTALAEVRKLYELAKKEGREDQQVKALLYTVQLQQKTAEQESTFSIRELEKELAVAGEPKASLLESLLASRYEAYLERNRWKIGQRTETAPGTNGDLTTWSTSDFRRKIASLYEASLSREEVLKKTPAASYSALLVPGREPALRPTLYDLLASEALDYFTGKGPHASDDEENQIADSILFLPARAFAATRFTSGDTGALYYKAFRLYQQLITFHLNDKRPEALIDADLRRLSFAYRYSSASDREERYAGALLRLRQQYEGSPATSLAGYELALLYEQRAQQYQPLQDTSYRFERLRARALLRTIVADSSVRNEGWNASYNLLQQIEKPALSFQLEKVNLPGEPFRVLVSYRNVEQLYLRILNFPADLRNRLYGITDSAYWKVLTNLPARSSWTQALPPTNDLQEHRVEIPVSALPVGAYLLLASAAPSFESQKGQLSAGSFQVSEISFIQQNEKLFVLHRKTGLPMAGATVKAYTKDYDSKLKAPRRIGKGSFRADSEGRVVLPSTSYGNYLLDLGQGSDSLITEDYLYVRSTEIEREEDPQHTIFFFTDRSIYRPGQTVQAKGIVTQKGNERALAPGTRLHIYLYNPDSDPIDSAWVTANEYGSFRVSFPLPRVLRTGDFSIGDADEENTISFSVEEYKRPRFAVSFDPVSKPYRLNDSVALTGTARSYAGPVLPDASVKYRITRRPIWQPYFTYSRRPSYGTTEIAHGTVRTDSAGIFRLSFYALPHPKMDTSGNPLFTYVVDVDVTDESGETRSASQSVNASLHPLQIQVQAKDKLPLDSSLRIMVKTSDANGNFRKALVRVLLTRLRPEPRMIRERYWEEPDQFVLSHDAYVALFPHDEYSHESQPSGWPREGLALDMSDSTKENGSWNLSDKNLQPGYYEIEAVLTEPGGGTLRTKDYVELFDPRDQTMGRPEYLWVRASTPIEPGQQTAIELGTSDSVYLIRSLDKRMEGRPDSSGKISTTRLAAGRHLFPFGATEEDRGGYGAGFYFVRDNRFHSFTDIIQVPWTNKQLQLRYMSFRDKALPGGIEQWKVEVRGPKGDAVAAELVAAMYDASLDAFRGGSWSLPEIWPDYSFVPSWESDIDFEKKGSRDKLTLVPWKPVREDAYRLNFGGTQGNPILLQRTNYNRINADSFFEYFSNDAAPIRGNTYSSNYVLPYKRGEELITSNVQMEKFTPPVMALAGRAPGLSVRGRAGFLDVDADGITDQFDKKAGHPNDPVQIRKNLNETAFFFPQLQTGDSGSVAFTFTLPEALTRWKLQTFAHTRDLAFGIDTREMVTQKSLMVQPSLPRFLRQGDHMELPIKISNLSDSEQTGQVQLELLDAATMQSVDGWFINSFPNQYFTVAARGSEVVKFPVQVPYTFNSTLIVRATARSGQYSDGEENTLPVLPSRVLVTETLPLVMKGSGTKQFRFDKLLHAGESESLQHQSLTVEYSSNPAWYAVLALPYLMEFPYECAEQTWNRYYANTVAAHILSSIPKVRAVLERWRTRDTGALLSNLEKNPELKSALLEETPWVLQARSETERRQNLVRLFDLTRLAEEGAATAEKLSGLQNDDGSFPWFKGGGEDRYISQYVLTGMGHLLQLGANLRDLQDVRAQLLSYLDRAIVREYEQLGSPGTDRTKDHLTVAAVQYLYARSYFTSQKMPQATAGAYEYFRDQARRFWAGKTPMLKAMIALALARTGDKEMPASILRSLRENTLYGEDLGRYTKATGESWLWQQAPLETQALLIEAFSEIGRDTRTVDELRLWLLQHKQANNWSTTRATADACYALLLRGSSWLSNTPSVTLRLGPDTFTSERAEEGTGYFQASVPQQRIRPEMGTVTVRVEESKGSTSPITLGAVYWQYFEDLDKITPASTSLQVTKRFFVETNTDKGPLLTPLEEGSTLHVGDKLVVRLEIRSDRDLEYVHLKDLRASSTEPLNVLSGYHWKEGLGYYESTRDISSNFFFDRLPRGTYVFEYPLFVTHTGSFQAGMATLQCMYAPEFSAHSGSLRVDVE